MPKCGTEQPEAVFMKIYLADDEKDIRDIMSAFLKNSGYEVTAFEDGDQLLEAFERDPADMVILDIMMPGTDGISLCSAIRQNCHVPIIIVSARDRELDRITGITIGADDYMVKPFAPMELVARVQSIFRRIAFCEAGSPKKILSYGSITLDLSLKQCMNGTEQLDLTPTEFAFMTYMLEHIDSVVSRQELMKHIWGIGYEADTKVCDDVLKWLRKKLLKTDVRIRSVWGYGFKLEQEEADDQHTL